MICAVHDKNIISQVNIRDKLQNFDINRRIDSHTLSPTDFLATEMDLVTTPESTIPREKAFENAETSNGEHAAATKATILAANVSFMVGVVFF